jgi:hypothetical protein
MGQKIARGNFFVKRLHIMRSIIMKFITVNGVVLSDYLISCKDGVAQIWSAKGEELTPMVMPTSGKSDYPKKGFMINGKPLLMDLHRVIAENLLPFPRPKNITPAAWKRTPVETKNLIKSLMFVNHIDHDKYNWRLDNLEWVTSKENRRAAVKHYGTNRG